MQTTEQEKDLGVESENTELSKDVAKRVPGNGEIGGSS